MPETCIWLRKQSNVPYQTKRKTTEDGLTPIWHHMLLLKTSLHLNSMKNCRPWRDPDATVCHNLAPTRSCAETLCHRTKNHTPPEQWSMRIQLPWLMSMINLFEAKLTTTSGQEHECMQKGMKKRTRLKTVGRHANQNAQAKPWHTLCNHKISPPRSGREDKKQLINLQRCRQSGTNFSLWLTADEAKSYAPIRILTTVKRCNNQGSYLVFDMATAVRDWRENTQWCAWAGNSRSMEYIQDPTEPVLKMNDIIFLQIGVSKDQATSLISLTSLNPTSVFPG